MSEAVVPAIVNVAGGTLFHLAAKHYGDATQWYRIASANRLTDPMLTGVVTLVLPRPISTVGNGGILDA